MGSPVLPKVAKLYMEFLLQQAIATATVECKPTLEVMPCIDDTGSYYSDQDGGFEASFKQMPQCQAEENDTRYYDDIDQYKDTYVLPAEATTSAESTPWMSFPGVILTQEDRSIILNNNWLNDKHIEGAQKLLALQFPEMGSLQPPGNLVAVSGRFVQTLFTNGNHWITVSNIGDSKEDEVSVYDSSYSSLREDIIINIIKLIHPKDGNVNVIVQPMQQQSNEYDCGSYALAAATDICHGLDPTKMSYNEKGLRQHLEKCFQQGKIDPFPRSVTPDQTIRSTKEVIQFMGVAEPAFTNNSIQVDPYKGHPLKYVGLL